MKLMDASAKILDDMSEYEFAKRIERAGRVCYQSQRLRSVDTAESFVKMLIRNGHESVLEHEKVTVRVICDRGVSHEWVRHRIASYSQESTRYCDYSSDRFDGELTFIKPSCWPESSDAYRVWKRAMEQAEGSYLQLIQAGMTAEQARGVLPNSLKTELVVTMNLREWRHFFRLRTAKAAHPQMRKLACGLLDAFKSQLPCFFFDMDWRVGP